MAQTARAHGSWRGSWTGCRWRWSRPPLALEQAAAYLRATEKSLAGYLALFRLGEVTC
jgi:hypothetical protein